MHLLTPGEKGLDFCQGNNSYTELGFWKNHENDFVALCGKISLLILIV